MCEIVDAGIAAILLVPHSTDRHRIQNTEHSAEYRIQHTEFVLSSVVRYCVTASSIECIERYSGLTEEIEVV